MRRASGADVPAVAALFRTTRSTSLAFLPDVHTPEEDVAYFRETAFPQCEIWVAADRTEILGFCAFRSDWVDHLYVHPQYARRGIGTRLLCKAMESHSYLQLWVFQKNAPAIGFYESMGFRLLRLTDGRENQEREPDALYAWSSSSDPNGERR